MASITGAGQQPLEFYLAECPDPKETVRRFLRLLPPGSNAPPELKAIYSLKEQFIRTQDRSILAEIVYRLGQKFFESISWGDANSDANSLLWPCFPRHGQGYFAASRFFNSIPLGARVEAAHIDGESFQGIKRDNFIITKDAEEKRLYKMVYGPPCHVRVLPEGLNHEVKAELNNHLIPDVTDIALSYLRGPSLYEEDIAKLRRELEGFVPPS